MEDIFAENAFIAMKDSEFYKLKGANIGTEFELNDRRGVIVGLAHVASSGLFGVPTLYTTYFRTLQYIPNTRFTISYVLVEPKTPADVANIKRQVAAAGYLALTKDEFIQKISYFYKYQTGFGTNLLIMTVMSFIVGLSISGQTFYTFILENLDKFGALKAIGAKGRELISMILFQATFVSLTGYGFGVGLCALVIWLARLYLPDYAAIVIAGNLGLAFVMVVVIASISSYIGVRKVLKIEPFDIFRASDAADRHPGRRTQQVVRRGRGENPRRPGRELRRPIRRDALCRGSVRQRHDHDAQHHLWHLAAE